MIPVVALAVVALIAGKPGTVVCDADTNQPAGAPPGFVVTGWTYPGTGVSHLTAERCSGLNAKPGSLAFAQSLHVLIHESAHQRGVIAEDCAETWADLVVFDVLRRFYGIPFFTPLSRMIGEQVYAGTIAAPPNYRPTLSSCS